jgi:hypothetical protein
VKKIPCVFVRDFLDDHRALARDEVTPGCEWVLAGEGVATRKRDGTAVALLEGGWCKRYDCKRGKVPPAGFVPCQEPDPITGHWPGWIKVDADNPADRWVCEAIRSADVGADGPGTYEACGPKIGGNAEGLERHELFKHGSETCEVERSFEGIKNFLTNYFWEGLVFHHPDGRMAKIHRSAFGLPWADRKPRQRLP